MSNLNPYSRKYSNRNNCQKYNHLYNASPPRWSHTVHYPHPLPSPIRIQSSHRHTQLKPDQWQCGSGPMQISSPRWLGVELPFHSEGISHNTLCWRYPTTHTTNTHTHTHTHTHFPVKCFQLGSHSCRCADAGKVIPQVRKRHCCLGW